MMLWFIMGVIVGVVLAIFTIGVWVSAKRRESEREGGEDLEANKGRSAFFR